MTKSYPQTMNNAGLVFTNRVRETGTLVSLYRSAEAGIEDDPSLPYTTMCEAHGGCVCHANKTLAMGWVAHPLTWCEGCQHAAGMILFHEGDRVYYMENGPTDTGEIIDIDSELGHLVVWDDGDKADWYTAGQLALIPGQR
jgi:hypothetical protein